MKSEANIQADSSVTMVNVKDNTNFNRDVKRVALLDTKPHLINIRLQGKDVFAEIDSGDCANIVSAKLYNSLPDQKILQPTVCKFYAANFTNLQLLGKDVIMVQMESQIVYLELFIVQYKLRYVIMGRTGLNMLWLQWRESVSDRKNNSGSNFILEINNNIASLKQQLLTEFNEVFNDDVQTPVNNYEVSHTLQF